MGARRAKKSQYGPELSSSSDLIRGMRFQGGKFPGHRVVEEVWKGPGDTRVLKFFGGQTRKVSKREVAELARDRGFDKSVQRYALSTPDTRRQMIRGSLQWQRKAKARWIGKYEKKLAAIKNPEKRRRMEEQLDTLRAAPVRSPLSGSRPVSSYVRRYWD